jgi:hypothetical protein
MVALYALVEAVHESKIAESEIIFTTTLPDATEYRTEIIVRNAVRPLTSGFDAPLPPASE